MTSLPVETFPALSALPAVRHAFICRVPGVDVDADRAIALERLEQFHHRVLQELGFDGMSLATAEQVHGCEVAVVDETTRGPVASADGLITNRTGVCLGIHVADCCALYLHDRARRCIGLVHSGRKGTELGIAQVAIEKMRATFGSRPQDIIAQLSPCIRPPHYDTDFAAEIVEQCRKSGVRDVFDEGVCTACHTGRYYSYRAEHGRTGRMLALMSMV